MLELTDLATSGQTELHRDGFRSLLRLGRKLILELFALSLLFRLLLLLLQLSLFLLSNNSLLLFYSRAVRSQTPLVLFRLLLSDALSEKLLFSGREEERDVEKKMERS